MTRVDSSQEPRSADEWSALLRLLPGYDPFDDAEGCYFDAHAAWRAIDFFPSCLRHVKGSLAGTPIILEPWQQAFVANLFGWKREADDTRRYRESMLYVARKNGKTVLVAGICCYVLFCDGEPGAEIYSAASDTEQAALVFAHASGMVRQEPELERRCQIYGSASGVGQRSIVIAETASAYKVISAEAASKHGFNTHFAIIDELHAQPNRDLVDVLQTSTGSREQPMIVHVTTADFVRPSICNEKHDYATKVRDGVISDPSFLPAIYEAPEEADWTDPEVWKLANPNMGVSVSVEYLERECKRAQESATYEMTFRRLHCQMKTRSAVKWLDLKRWNECAQPIPWEQLKGRKARLGIDTSSTADITSLCILIDRDDEGRPPYLTWRFFVPGDNAHIRERRDKVPYETWAAQGHLTLTDGDTIDLDYIRDEILDIAGHVELIDAAIDPWNSQHLQTQLAGEGIAVVQFRQNYASMTSPSKEFEARIRRRDLEHDANPVMAWMITNAVVEQDHNQNIRPSKKKSTEKIDGVVSSIEALGRYMTEAEDTTSVYESHGIRTL